MIVQDEVFDLISELRRELDGKRFLDAVVTLNKIDHLLLTSGVVCPFCGDFGFDKIGLKYHLTECEEFHKTYIL